MTTMNLHPNIIAEISGDLDGEFKEQKDWQVIIDCYLEMGWTKVQMDWSPRIPDITAHDVKEWCRANLQGHYNGRNKIWLFEKEKDAMLFTLRWS